MTFAEYIKEELATINYAEYISKNLSIDSADSNSYVEYIAENLGYDFKSKKQILRETRIKKLQKLNNING